MWLFSNMVRIHYCYFEIHLGLVWTICLGFFFFMTKILILILFYKAGEKEWCEHYNEYDIRPINYDVTSFEGKNICSKYVWAGVWDSITIKITQIWVMGSRNALDSTKEAESKFEGISLPFFFFFCLFFFLTRDTPIEVKPTIICHMGLTNIIVCH